jgi:hypothetical protein
MFEYMAAVTRTSSNNLTANENPGRNGPFRCLQLISLHRSMFPAEFVDFFCLLGVGTGGGTAESDGFCAWAELVGLHRGQH